MLHCRYDERVSIAVKAPAVKLLKPPPKEGSLYDYAYVLDGSAWKRWTDLQPPQTLTDTMHYEDITVMTLDVARYTYLMGTFIQHGHPVLLCGPTGTGKSVYTKDYLATKLDRAKWTYMAFGFSAQTSANLTQVRQSCMPHSCVHRHTSICCMHPHQSVHPGKQ